MIEISACIFLQIFKHFLLSKWQTEVCSAVCRRMSSPSEFKVFHYFLLWEKLQNKLGLQRLGLIDWLVDQGQIRTGLNQVSPWEQRKVTTTVLYQTSQPLYPRHSKRRNPPVVWRGSALGLVFCISWSIWCICLVLIFNWPNVDNRDTASAAVVMTQCRKCFSNLKQLFKSGMILFSSNCPYFCLNDTSVILTYWFSWQQKMKNWS